jgi:hypothetical protein
MAIKNDSPMMEAIKKTFSSINHNVTAPITIILI